MNTPPPDERGGRARAKSISVTPVSQHTRVHVPQPTVNPLTSPNFHSQDPKVNGSPLQIHGIPCDPAPAASPNFKDPSDNGTSSTGATTSSTTMIPPKKEHNIEEVIATIFSYNKRSGQIVNKQTINQSITHTLTHTMLAFIFENTFSWLAQFYNIQVCTRTTQGELEIRILSYQIKSFVTLYKQVQKTMHIRTFTYSFTLFFFAVKTNKSRH